MKRQTSMTPYGLIEGALSALTPFALLMANNQAENFPALMPFLATCFTAGCGIATTRLLFTNPQYGKLFCWLFWLGALVGCLPILTGSPFASLLFATLFIISGFALTRFKINLQASAEIPFQERCRQRALGAALVLLSVTLVSAFLNQADSMNSRFCFSLGMLATLLLLVRWVKPSKGKGIYLIHNLVCAVVLLVALTSMFIGHQQVIGFLVALLMIIPLRSHSKPTTSREHWWELVLNHPGRTLVSTFLTLCIVGAFLLNLSVSTVHPDQISFVDKLFTAVSAVCVTGLTVMDISEEFTVVGQVLILIMIQLGGLGIMTIATAAMHAIGNRISLSQERVMSSLTDSDHKNLTKALKLILEFTFIVEAGGAIFLTIGFMLDGFSFGQALWQGCFTAISAFCNAGFSLSSTNLVAFSHNPMVLLPVSLLIIIGGIAPHTALLLPAYFSGHTIPLNARLVITTTITLLITGTILVLIFEWNQTLGNLRPLGKILNAWFQSASFRTAGFNSVDTATTTIPTYIIMIIFMFIGASPGGTAGGVKTTTLAVLALTFWKNVTSTGDLNIQHRHINHKIVYRAITIVIASGLILLTATMMLAITQTIPARQLLFEVTSALATAGLSIGATQQLDGIGKILIILTMFIGRIGPLTMFMLLDDTLSQTNAFYPNAKITLN